MSSTFSRWPPALRFLAAQLLAFGLLLALARWAGFRLPGWGWVGLQSLSAVLIGAGLGLSGVWTAVNLAVPILLDLVLRWNLPGWIAPLVLLALLLVFGGGLLTRVPLYHSNRDAWSRVLELLPPGPLRFVDLGAGFGGLLSHLAQARPEGSFVGVEASPLSWAVAALRCLARPNAHLRLGSLWGAGLENADVVFAFLSPVPMGALWTKVQGEMRPGTLFLSHTFAVPGVEPDRSIPLRGRRDAVLRVYVIRGGTGSVEGPAPVL